MLFNQYIRRNASGDAALIYIHNSEAEVIENTETSLPNFKYLLKLLSI